MHLSHPLLFPALLFLALCSQNTFLASAKAVDKVQSKAFIEINGQTYYYNDDFYVKWGSAGVDCAALNMTLVAFDQPGEWEAVRDYLLALGRDLEYFWTSGLKAAGSSTYYWSGTGQEVTEFHWGYKQPDAPSSIQVCITFYPDLVTGGYHDIDCTQYTMQYICE